MQHNHRSHTELNSRNQTTHARTNHRIVQIPQREFTPKEHAALDLFIILNTIMKRKFLRALEQIKLSNFNTNRKGVAGDHISWGFRLAQDRKDQTPKPRVRSLDPYAEYSRNRLLADIVAKLKAKKNGEGFDSQNTTALYQKLISLERQQQNSNTQQYFEQSHKNGMHNLQTGNLRGDQANFKDNLNQYFKKANLGDNGDAASNISPIQQSANSSVFQQLPEILKKGSQPNNNSKPIDFTKKQTFQSAPALHHQSSSKEDINQVRYFVSPQSGKSRYLPDRFYQNNYESITHNQGLNSQNSNWPSIPPSPNMVPRSFEKYYPEVTPQNPKQRNQNKIYHTSGASRNEENKKINIMSKIPYKSRSGAEQNSTQTRPKKTYEVRSSGDYLTEQKSSRNYVGTVFPQPDPQSYLRNQTPPRSFAPRRPDPITQSEQVYCDECDRYCSCKP